MSLYSLRSLTTDSFTITKFDDDLNPEASYNLTKQGFSYTCDCPANNRTVITKPCRHKLMMPKLLPEVNTGRFYDHDTGVIIGAVEEPTEAPAEAFVGEAPRAKAISQNETSIFLYLTDEPPREFTHRRVIDLATPTSIPAPIPSHSLRRR